MVSVGTVGAGVEVLGAAAVVVRGDVLDELEADAGLPEDAAPPLDEVIGVPDRAEPAEGGGFNRADGSGVLLVLVVGAVLRAACSIESFRADICLFLIVSTTAA